MSTLQYPSLKSDKNWPMPKDDLYKKTIQLHSKSFSFASKLLPKSIREDAITLYAWCRYVDDEIDCTTHKKAIENLDRLQQELDLIYSQNTTLSPLLKDLQAIFHKHNIPKQYPQQLLFGMKMDLEQTTYENLSDLLLYCYRVAGTVGLMMSHIMGVTHNQALKHAANMGMAMQLTNISRDVLEDWNRKRCYLPNTLILQQSPALALASKPTTLTTELGITLSKTLPKVLKIADQYYASGSKGLRFLNLRCAIAISAAKHIYAHIGNEIAKQDFNIERGRAFVSKSKKINLAIVAFLKVSASIPSRLMDGLFIHSQKKQHKPALVLFEDTIITTEKS